MVEVPHGILHLVTENLVRTGSPKYDRIITMESAGWQQPRLNSGNGPRGKAAFGWELCSRMGLLSVLNR
ncbi:hypothetical protein TESG_08516 [Trichophyton tonsurans CBS 112818]|uniref:Uncharacterized protein n=2 Tax=Trichophyton TaxID=5550 RepID=F2PSX9_TRIEC|nr:hypothetical protein TESG_08516 [Trichophyton tonsurans CBS 112818]EGE04997.1 hypothetical protein TEQG_08678 [Trichophyton equinum CBS 127.97]